MMMAFVGVVVHCWSGRRFNSNLVIPNPSIQAYNPRIKVQVNHPTHMSANMSATYQADLIVAD